MSNPIKDEISKYIFPCLSNIVMEYQKPKKVKVGLDPNSKEEREKYCKHYYAYRELIYTDIEVLLNDYDKRRWHDRQECRINIYEYPCGQYPKFACRKCIIAHHNCDYCDKYKYGRNVLSYRMMSDNTQLLMDNKISYYLERSDYDFHNLYCQVCKCILKPYDEVFDHIKTINHKKNIERSKPKIVF
jgi:hypothetical protein